VKSSKVSKLVLKYNEVLKESMRNVVAEDLVNLIIVNGDDKEFELKDMISKKAKFKEMGNTCVFCGTDQKVGLDHDIPFAQGGLNVLKNVQPCCKPCNSSKKDKTSDEYREKLKG